MFFKRSQIQADCTPGESPFIGVLRSENLQLKAGLANIQANLAESVSVNNENIDCCQQIEENCEELSRESASIHEATDALSDALTEMRELAEETDRKLESIRSFVELIEDVSAKTKLLALNATIEAARAGEAGKGFAVVADEVKSLSSQTQDAVASIGDSIEEILANSNRVAESMRGLDERSDQMRETVSAFNDRIVETNSQNVESTRRVIGANDRVFMSLAKLDHIIWKVNTYLSVLDGQPAFDFVDYHNCRLGKWYYDGDGQQSFSSMPSFRGLETPHAQVHESTRRVFDILDSDLPNDDPVIAEALEEMERGSDGVFEYLDQILTEKKSVTH